MYPIFCKATGLSETTRVLFKFKFRAGNAGGNETHILRLQDKTLFWGVKELRETHFTLFLGNGAEGKVTHLHVCWVVSYIC